MRPSEYHHERKHHFYSKRKSISIPFFSKYSPETFSAHEVVIISIRKTEDDDDGVLMKNKTLVTSV